MQTVNYDDDHDFTKEKWVRIRIEFDVSRENTNNLSPFWRQIDRKIGEILSRAPGCLCDAPESADVIKNYWGTTVGTIEIVGDAP